jgi:diketogulonate reductase-like aldo/keto reductase
MVVTMAALLFAASLTAAAVAPTVEIVPGVLMPMIVDGYDYGKQKKDTTWFVLGGRGVHTAESYVNQVAVGNSLRAQKVVVREEFLLQTKIECMGSVESTIAAGEDDLAQLGMDYVDLLLIHTPYLGWGEPYSNSSQGAAGKAERQATWRGMEALQRAGKAKAIGVELQHR